jgi:arsenate reductase
MTSKSPDSVSAGAAADASNAQPVTIYHNKRCGTSRKTLELLLAHGVEPVVVDYLQTPPTRAALKAMIGRAGLTVRGAIREKEAVYATLNLAEASDAALLDAMTAHPILINRPFVVTPLGVRLCRPVEAVLEILA